MLTWIFYGTRELIVTFTRGTFLSVMAARKRLSGTEKANDRKFASECHREETFAASRSSKSDRLFDTIIGHIEDIIIDDKFHQLQQTFLDSHYMVFEDAEENKLIYTNIHRAYVETVEQFLEVELHQRMPSFNMTEFQKQLVARSKHLDGEVFEMLLTFTDFPAFKELVLDYKAEKGSRCSFSDSLIVCQPLCSVQASSAECAYKTAESEQRIANDEPEPMRISLDFAKTDSDEEMSVLEEQLDVNVDSVGENDRGHAATSS